MTSLMDAIVGGESAGAKDPRFPNAPAGWTAAAATEAARKEGLALSEEHWEALRALQEFYVRHGPTEIHLRDLHDALDERFHQRGGIKRLYQLFPGGPVAQGSRLAGLDPPAGAVDKGFGSTA
ncbi:MAG TPA: TusE/DsrC/DsvC family sulfur relay protein [Usitatibacter sp.]|nr:TusE/DsrC/DsvC family sulfur relay protein [Usitatibacter sp.]